jgi:hypothetical protein
MATLPYKMVREGLPANFFSVGNGQYLYQLFGFVNTVNYPEIANSNATVVCLFKFFGAERPGINPEVAGVEVPAISCRIAPAGYGGPQWVE